MAEAIASLVSDSESPVVMTGYVVIYAPKRGNRKRFPENCVIGGNPAVINRRL